METHFENIERAHSDLAFQRVLADLKTLVRDSEELLRVTAGDLSQKAKEARSRLAAALESARGTCQNVQTQTLDAAKAAARQADVLVREHPYESVGIAFGAGLLLGVLVGRR
jgi:ElaB/YqjD/DUF883 family membrane-anchored ribosome-binding protein